MFSRSHFDDTEDRVHGGQQLALWNAHYDSRCFLPIHIYEATSGKPVAVTSALFGVLPGRRPCPLAGGRDHRAR